MAAARRRAGESRPFRGCHGPGLRSQTAQNPAQRTCPWHFSGQRRFAQSLDRSLAESPIVCHFALLLIVPASMREVPLAHCPTEQTAPPARCFHPIPVSGGLGHKRGRTARHARQRVHTERELDSQLLLWQFRASTGSSTSPSADRTLHPAVATTPACPRHRLRRFVAPRGHSGSAWPEIRCPRKRTGRKALRSEFARTNFRWNQRRVRQASPCSLRRRRQFRASQSAGPKLRQHEFVFFVHCREQLRKRSRAKCIGNGRGLFLRAWAFSCKQLFKNAES